MKMEELLPKVREKGAYIRRPAWRGGVVAIGPGGQVEIGLPGHVTAVKTDELLAGDWEITGPAVKEAPLADAMWALRHGRAVRRRDWPKGHYVFVDPVGVLRLFTPECAGAEWRPGALHHLISSNNWVGWDRSTSEEYQLP